MKIDEAIKVLENDIRVAEVNDYPWEVKAFKLGIEALTLLQNPTDPRLIYARKLLLGEIKE